MSAPILPWLKDLVAMNLGRTKPFRVILMLTGKCGLKCRTCGIWKKGAEQDPSLPELERFFTINDFSWINLTGGEIFLRNDLSEIFSLIASTQHRLAFINFPTSGFWVEKTLTGVKTAVEAGLPRLHVTVSFDGGREAHDRLRGVEGAFDRAAETWKGLKELAQKHKGRLTVLPGMTLSKELLELSTDPLHDLMRDLAIEGAHEVHVNLAHQAGHYYANPDLGDLPVQPVTALLDRMIRARGRRWSPLDLLERFYLKGAVKYVATGKAPLGCKALTASVFVDAQWTVYPCTIFSHPLGSLKEVDFDLDRIKGLPAYHAARKAVVSGACPGCWTPCEAYTAMSGALLSPFFLKLALMNGAQRTPAGGEGAGG